MKTTLSVILTAAVLVCFAQVAQAAAITGVTNGNFELPSGVPGTEPNYVDNVVPTDWSLSANAGYSERIGTDYNNDLYPQLGGNTAVLLSITDASWGLGRTGIQQVLGQMVAGETYDFSATLGGASQANPPAWQQGLTVARYSIRFEDATTSTVLSEITDLNFNPAPLGTIVATMSYTAPALLAGDTLRLVLETRAIDGFSAGNGNRLGRMAIDDVSVTVTPPVPEPSTLVMLAAGLLSLVAYAWRKRK